MIIWVRNTLKYIAVTRLVVKYNIGTYLPKDNPILKELEKLLLLNRSMFYTKL